MTGRTNSLLGGSAGKSITSGSQNTFIGYEAGTLNTTGTQNTYVGHHAGRRSIGTFSNTFIGSLSGAYNVTGQYNTFIGSQAGFINTAGISNTFVGSGAGQNNTDGSNNVFVGSGSGVANTTGNNNLFLGLSAGNANVSGQLNVYMGAFAGYSNQSGLGNMFLGQQAGYFSTGSYNLFMGNSSGSRTTTGDGNTAIGDGSLLKNITGVNNAAIGRYAGVESYGSENVFIGFAADVNPNTPGVTNATAIGARARVSQSNSIVLGANANVGIGNGAPSAKLHITTGTANTSGLRLENLTSNSPASATSQAKFLTVDGAGNVILGSLSGSAREGAVEALWQRNGTLLQSLNGESVVIGSKVGKTPSGYKLFVEEGILTEKVKVAVKNTSEWSDKVFDTGYPLKSLDEVGKYIQANKHLPGVPSAVEVVEKGIDVAKMDAKLLEKIEELTLYSILLEKTAKQQQAQIDELKQLVQQLANKK
ncbi:TMF family protein [Spirosoma agri]|uniref:TMF family protein n=1 Tax=Spirosoma agri TaxID=1987381 RepID=A0A6M0IMI2_9BACT|nr:TMF family protein [Spirosoma agri]